MSWNRYEAQQNEKEQRRSKYAMKKGQSSRGQVIERKKRDKERSR